MSLDSRTGHTPAKKGLFGVRRFGAYQSKSSGFFKRGKKMKRFKKVKRALNKGVVFVQEKGGSLQSLYCRYIGHATHPRETVMRIIWYAIIKRLLIRVGYQVEQSGTAIGGLAAGETISVTYKVNPTSTIASQTFTAGATSTLDQIAGYMYTNIPVTNNLELIGCNYNPSGTSLFGRHLMNLQNIKIKVDIKSTLKIQNRSANSLGSESDEVDNVPLYGRSYYGKGNGSTVSNTLLIGAQTLYADDYSALIALDGAVDMREPILPPQAIMATRAGKAHLDPGQIKTSVLTYKFTENVN